MQVWHSNSPLRIESAGCLGITWVAGVFCCLFSQDQFSGMGLAQQVVLAVMLDNDPPFITQQFCCQYDARQERGRRCVFL
jgi:hypothetical protein